MIIKNRHFRVLISAVSFIVIFAFLTIQIPLNITYASSDSSELPKITSLTYKINGTETTTSENGNLSTTVVVSNSGFSGNVICFVAIDGKSTTTNEAGEIGSIVCTTLPKDRGLIASERSSEFVVGDLRFTIE